MPRPRLPQAKAEISGAALINAGRFAGRKAPKVKRPIGEPYASMTEAQKAQWADLVDSIPWLNSSHRQVLRLASSLAAQVEDGTITTAGISALSAILSKLGATPADETKVTYDPGDSDEPEDKFFGRSN